jgi:NTP pyrophosphatase (non-canonical NTP hydrolase)
MMTLTDIDFSYFVDRLAKPGVDIVESMTADNAHILHMAVGIAGEAGELLDAVKKGVIYNKPFDEPNILEELGDLEFYMEGLRQAFGLSRSEVIEHNVAKLSLRYGGGYSDQAAQDRADKSIPQTSGN